MSWCSEAQFQGQLKGARSALLKYGIQAAETLIRHRRRTEKCRAKPDKSKWVGEVGMVEQIECVRAELQSNAICYRKFPAERQIHLRQSKTTNIVPALGPLLTSR